MPQIYNTPAGPALLVRYEDRGNGMEYMFVVAYPDARNVGTVWLKTLPEDYELVHDPGSRAEADIYAAENGALIREKAILLECLGAALGMLDERSAEQVRDIYRTKMQTADLVSLTQPSDLLSITKGEQCQRQR